MNPIKAILVVGLAAKDFAYRNQRVRFHSLFAAGNFIAAAALSAIPYTSRGTVGLFVLVSFFGGFIVCNHTYQDSHDEVAAFTFGAGIPYFAWEAWNLPALALWIPFVILCADILFLKRRKRTPEAPDSTSAT